MPLLSRLAVVTSLFALASCAGGPSQQKSDEDPLQPDGSGGAGSPSPGSSMSSNGDGTGPGAQPPAGPGSSPPGGTSVTNPPPNTVAPVTNQGGAGRGSDLGNAGAGGMNGPGPTGPGNEAGSGPGVGGGGAGNVDVPVDRGGNGGSASPGGTAGMGGSGPDLDQEGKANAKPGDMTSVPQDYLRLGDIRILNNNWGSEDLGCNASMSVFVNQDSTFGWNFNRGDCDTADSNQKPDFPQIEFGIHPFGIGSDLVTSPEFSSTTLMPLQIKDIQSASVSIQNLTANLQQESSWNITFEFWISERNPVTDPNPGVYAELMTFWGWQSGRWPEPPAGNGPQGNGAGNQVASGGKSYTLWVQDDNWASGWRYFQFRADDGPQRNFNGTLDVKPFLDYLVNSRQYSPDFWVTRLEVGSEIDDNTAGSVQLSGITFEVNGETRSATIDSN